MSSILTLLAAHKLPVLIGSLCTTVVCGGVVTVSMFYSDVNKQEPLKTLDLKEELSILEPQLQAIEVEDDEYFEVSNEDLQEAKGKRTNLIGGTSGFISLSNSILREIEQYTPKRKDLEQCLKSNPTNISLDANHINDLFNAKEEAMKDVKSVEEMLKTLQGSLRDRESKVEGNRNKEEFEKLKIELSDLEKNYNKIVEDNSASSFKNKLETFLGTIKTDREKCGIKDMIRMNESNRRI